MSSRIPVRFPCIEERPNPIVESLSSCLCEIVGILVLSGLVDTSGESDRERVECSFPSFGAGSEFASALMADIADREVEDLVDGVFGREMTRGFS